MFARLVARGVVAWSVLVCLASAWAAEPKAQPVTVALLGKDFPLQGDWIVQTELHNTVLFASPDGLKFPPVAAIVVPRAGKYRLWVAARDFPNDRPGIRTFGVRIGGKPSEAIFGKSGKENFELEDGGVFDLPAGPTLVSLDRVKAFARFYGLVLTTSAERPKKPLSPTAYPLAKLHKIELPQSAGPQSAPLTVEAGDPLAVLGNQQVRFAFLPARRGDLKTVSVAVQVKSGEAWRPVDIDPAAESYFATLAPATMKLGFSGFYPIWKRSNLTPATVEVAGVRESTIPSRSTYSQIDAGTRTVFFPRAVTAKGSEVRIDFHPSPAGQLAATWRLAEGQTYADVELNFTPAAEGQVGLGYELFFRRELARVNELLLPMMYLRKRLPEFEVTLLSSATPTPVALVEPAGASPVSLALAADPRDIPYEWPDGPRSPYALSIRGPGATVQPAICGPVLGTPAAAAKAGQAVRLRYKLLVQPGDWYAAFRATVDRIYGVRDYRQTVAASLSDAVLNMIDLYMDDDHGGWWERAKAPYQIESKNGSTHSSPMLPLALYRLSGDNEMLRRRALPTLAFMLSRDGAHFSPVPEDPGQYPSGSMNGPAKLFGTATYAGLWELSGRRAPAYLEIAFPPGDPRPTAGYSHAAAFDEYMARYQTTGDQADLDKACAAADTYIAQHITKAPQKDIGPQPFFFISFVPDWEGLLRLYEMTGKRPYLDAAVFGARQLMTGLWTQPVIPEGKITIHPDGQFNNRLGHDWWKGPERFRLGSPRTPNDTPTRDVPAWIVSNVGLGYEQPITYRSSGAGRLIWQMGWSAHFLRLYRYTGDQAFLTCARNAVVGRWSNYPGYYITGFTDLPQRANYPMTGPDVTEFYYHHIGPHLAWSIDYLVSEAEMLSDGAIAFPSLRQYGYAYFDSRIFGHAPGKVYDDAAAWLLLRRGVVECDNPQVNTLLAWSEGKLHVMLTNQSQQAQTARIRPGAKLPAGAAQASVRIGAAGPQTLALAADRSAQVTLPPRGLATVTLTGVKVDPPARPQMAGLKAEGCVVKLASDGAEARAAAIQVEPGKWYAYAWSTASPQQARAATLRYRVAGQGETAWQTLTKNEYPLEFTVPADEGQALELRLDLTLVDGKTAASAPATLRLPAPPAR